MLTEENIREIVKKAVERGLITADGCPDEVAIVVHAKTNKVYYLGEKVYG